MVTKLNVTQNVNVTQFSNDLPIVLKHIHIHKKIRSFTVNSNT